jgi:hypothetical protein
MSCNNTLHDITQVLVTTLIRGFPLKGRTTRLRRHCNSARVLLCIAMLVPPGGARRRRSGGPGGGALAGPSASLHLPVVGAGNSVTVPDLARSGAKRAGTTIRDQHFSGKPSIEGF